MFATWSIQSELDINKLRTLGSCWWVLFAGDDISPVFDIIEDTKEEIDARCKHAGISSDFCIPVTIVVDALRQAYE